jgi:hypothetical protein
MPADVPLLAGVDLAFIDFCEKAVERSRSLAEIWLKRYMLRGRDQKAEEVASILSEPGKRYLSHGQVIGWKEAKKELDLNVKYLPIKDDKWGLIWEIYVRSEVFLRQTGHVKLFENNKISTAIRVMPTPS